MKLTLFSPDAEMCVAFDVNRGKSICILVHTRMFSRSILLLFFLRRCSVWLMVSVWLSRPDNYVSEVFVCVIDFLLQKFAHEWITLHMLNFLLYFFLLVCNGLKYYSEFKLAYKLFAPFLCVWNLCFPLDFFI